MNREGEEKLERVNYDLLEFSKIDCEVLNLKSYLKQFGLWETYKDKIVLDYGGSHMFIWQEVKRVNQSDVKVLEKYFYLVPYDEEKERSEDRRYYGSEHM